MQLKIKTNNKLTRFKALALNLDDSANIFDNNSIDDFVELRDSLKNKGIKIVYFSNNQNDNQIDLQKSLSHLGLMSSIEDIYVVSTSQKQLSLAKILGINENELVVVSKSLDALENAITFNNLPVFISQKEDFFRNDVVVTDNILTLKYLFDLLANDGILKLLSFADSGTMRKNILDPHLTNLTNLKEVYVFGARQLGEKIANQLIEAGIEVLGFIDNDTTKQGNTLIDKSIMPLDMVKDKNAVFIIASQYLYDISTQLEDFGYKNHIPYPLLSLFDRSTFPPEWSYNNMQEDLIDNKYRYFSLFINLADNKSRDVLSGLINFRLTLNPFYTQSVSDSINHLYFNEITLPLSNNEVFVDGGGFDGETTLQFIENVPGTYKVFFFEPDPKLFDRCKLNLSEYGNIHFVNKGLFSKEKTLRFCTTGEMDGCINELGDLEIDVVDLDSWIDNKITFIKLDVEGAEAETINGAVNHIVNDKPKMAIALCHKSKDLWSIASLINSIDANYKFYLRHYSQTAIETNLYCIPI